MKMPKGLFVVATCLCLLLFPLAKSESLAACPTPVKILGSDYNPTSIQNAYDYASGTLALPDFTLLLAGEIFTENLFLDGGAVVLDGGYDCSFTTKTSTAKIFGSITISSGAATVSGINVVSTARCDFDADLDGFTSIGSCLGSADDCNDNNVTVYPGAAEICDGLDNDCNGLVDDGFLPTDADGDGYYGPASCGAVADDCNDNDVTIHPGALEIPYDGIDQDCNGTDMTFADGVDCADCHGIQPTGWNVVHAAVAPPDVTCANCHATAIVPGHYGDTVRTAGNNLPAGATIVCASCHDQNSENHDGVPIGNGSNVVWAKVIADWPNLTCDSCHENRALAHATATAHDNRIIDAGCDGCHTSDTAVLGSAGSGTLVSDADVDTLHRANCALCHSYTGTVLNTAVVRQAVQLGLSGSQISCKDCHTDKGVNHGNHVHPVEVGPNDLSYDAPGILCSDCHIVANWTEIETIEHNVATNGAGSCATCHNSSRQEVRDAISLGSNPTNCLDCHADKQLAPHGSVEHVAVGFVTGGVTSCVTCHDPGVGTNATVSVIHANNCSLCHAAGLVLQPGLPSGGGDCTACHLTAWEVTHTLNTPDHSSLVQVAASGCGTCHSDPPPLTNAADPKVHSSCFNCHDSEGGLVSLAVGQDFSIGGSCVSCHTGTWAATHTVAPDHSGIVNVSGISCGNCHDNSLTGATPKTHFACTSCHDANSGALISLAFGKSAPGNCTTCHGVDFTSIHPETIDHSSLITVATTGCADCHSNPPPLVDPADPKVHNTCSSCHDANGGLLSLALGQTLSAGGNCTSCHTGSWESTHTIAPAHNALVQVAASGCGDCHDDPPPLVDPLDPKVHNACSSCHNAADGALLSYAIGKTFAVGGDCTSCHIGTWASTHLVAPSHNALVNVGVTGCQDCHSTPPPLTDAADPKVHDDCASCHNSATGALVSLAIGKSFAVGGDCTSCHTGTWESTHVTAPSHNALVNVGTTSCASCHSSPPPLVDPLNPKVHNGCSSCHEATSGALISLAISKSFVAGGDCATCHTGTWGAIHAGEPDHSDIVTVGTTSCASCHDDTLVSGATTTHTDCANCHEAESGVLISLAIGKQAPGDCTTCHGSNFQTVHPSCTGCHAAPPSGATAPNREGAHTEHGVLGFGSVNPSCIACHDGLIHDNGSIDVGILSSFNAKSGVASSNGTTCSSTSCHGGQTTPAWSTGAINVSTQCNSCHAEGTAQYNSYYSGLHDMHLWWDTSCTNCHNPTKLATGHFSNLATTTFEQSPATTIGGTVARPQMTYVGGFCFNTTGCHGISAAGPWQQ